MLWNNFFDFFKSAMHIFAPVSCPVCGMLGEPLCFECAEKILSHNKYKYQNLDIYAASVYGGDVKRIIINLKYNGLKAAGKILGSAAAKIFARPDIDALVPVPLHAGSTRRYNQALEIARGLGAEWHIKVADICRWAVITGRHAAMNMAERTSLTSDAFKINNKKIKNLKIALVDDVCTTGATLKCLAAACENAGLHVAAAYVIARTEFLI